MWGRDRGAAASITPPSCRLEEPIMTEETGTPEALPVVPGAISASVRTELALFSAFVEGLALDDARKPSAVAGWTNLDVVAHVQLAMLLYDQLLAAGSKGWTGGAVGKAFGSLTKTVLPAAAGAFNTVNSLLPHALTGTLAPEAVKGQFLGNARWLRSRLDGLDSADFTKPIYYRGGPWPLSFFLAGILNELAMHRWDIESTLRPDAHLSAGSCEALPWFYWGGSGFMFHPGKEMAGTVAAALLDPAAEMSWKVESRVVTHERGLAPGAAATIHGEAGTFVLVLAGRITADDALRATSLTVEGDEALARALLSSWSVV
jgi:uncharacterized protein (TIGR03083 family)